MRVDVQNIMNSLRKLNTIPEPRFTCALVLLEVKEEMKQIITVSSSLVCYTCNEKERFFNVEINLVQQPSAILDRHALLHSNGHEGLGYIYQIVAPVLTQEEIKTNPRLAQCAKYLSVEPRCRNVFAVVLQMLMEKINISAVIRTYGVQEKIWASTYISYFKFFINCQLSTHAPHMRIHPGLPSTCAGKS